MPENIFQRARRIVSATLEDGIDRLEQVSGAKLMKQAVREVDYAIDDAQRAHDSASKRANIASIQSKSLQDDAKDWQDKAAFALAKNREELAEAALEAGLNCETRAKILSNEEAQAKDEMEKLQASRKALEAKRARMQDQLDNYLAEERRAATQTKPSPDNAKKMADIQESFEYIMSMAAGDKNAGRDTPAPGLSEFDDLHKDDEIEQRLAELKKSMQRGKPGKPEAR